jgi:hypothetical protein
MRSGCTAGGTGEGTRRNAESSAPSGGGQSARLRRRRCQPVQIGIESDTATTIVVGLLPAHRSDTATTIVVDPLPAHRSDTATTIVVGLIPGHRSDTATTIVVGPLPRHDSEAATTIVVDSLPQDRFDPAMRPIAAIDCPLRRRHRRPPRTGRDPPSIPRALRHEVDEQRTPRTPNTEHQTPNTEHRTPNTNSLASAVFSNPPIAPPPASKPPLPTRHSPHPFDMLID